MIDPATNWCEIVKLLLTEFKSPIPIGEKGCKGTATHNKPKEAYFNKSSAQVGFLVYKIWFSCYPHCIGSKFKLNFKTLWFKMYQA